MIRLALDFDGVLCNSVHEAFYSTWIAYNRYHLQKPLPNTIAIAIKDTFFRYRPFIRTGQHLMLLQHLIHNNIVLNTQADFEHQLATLTNETLQEWRRVLYMVREEIQKEDPLHQLALQPLYPTIREALVALSEAQDVIILSTKRADFINAILAHNGVPWPTNQIHSVNKESKIAFLERHHSPASTSEPLIFIDDHLPHLLSANNAARKGLRCMLATWGYVLDDWCRNRNYESINMQQFHLLVRSFFVSK